MSLFAECANHLPLIHQQEPLAGAAFAVNLAYLNLERFRYRADIRNHARKQRSRLDRNDTELPDYIRDHRDYKQVERLAALPDNANGEDSKKAGTRLPDGSLGWFYRKLFERHQDRVLSMVFTGVALLAVILGASSQMDYLTFTNCLSTGAAGIAWFWVLIVGICAPIGFVLLGGNVVSWAKRVSKSNIDELEKIMQAKAKEAKLDA